MIKRLLVANRGEIATQSDGLPNRIFIHRRVWSQRPQLPPGARSARFTVIGSRVSVSAW
jgi:hypothetical protein